MKESATVARSAEEQGSATASPLAILRTLVGSDWKWLVPGGGGLLLLLHFWRIGFVPSLSFADLGAVLGAFVLFFAAGVIAFSGLLLLPVLVIATWVRASVFLPPPGSLPSVRRDTEQAASPRKSLRSPRMRVSREPMSAARRRVLGVSMRPGSFLSFLTAAIAALAIYVGLVFAAMYWKLTSLTNVYTVLFAMSSGLLLWLSFLIDSGSQRRRLLALRHPAWQWMLLFTLYLAAWPFLLFLFAKVDGFSGAGPWFWVSAICVPLLTPFVHWIWYISIRVPMKHVMVPRLVMVSGLLLYSGLPLLLVDATANTLGLGMMRHVDLVLTSRGCDIVHAGWPERVCTPDHREGVEMGVLDDVEVLTRIGSQFYIAPPGGIADPHLPRITVPASEVLGVVRR